MTIACDPGNEALVAQSGMEPNTSVAVGEDTYEPVAVLELFTSQGCSSCPPADDNLGELAEQANQGLLNVIPLSFHVDYWNRLGWKDPYSQAAFSERQRWYGEKFGRVYTPQVVVNGTDEFVGSRRDRPWKEVGAALDEAATTKVIIKGEREGSKVNLHYAVEGQYQGSVLHVAITEKETSTEVPRGENGGRSLKNHQVVRVFHTLPEGFETRGHLSLPWPEGLNEGNAALVAYVQKASSGKITGASSNDIK